MRPFENGTTQSMTELDNNAAERVLRPIALGRKNFFSAGSENGGKSAAMADTPTKTAKLDGINPRARFTICKGDGYHLNNTSTGQHRSAFVPRGRVRRDTVGGRQKN